MLPPGGVVPQDYLFKASGPGGSLVDVRLSELFEPGKNSLAMSPGSIPGTTVPSMCSGTFSTLLPTVAGPTGARSCVTHDRASHYLTLDSPRYVTLDSVVLRAHT
jgi:hypothetical protein